MTEPYDSLHVVFGAAGAIGGAAVTELLRLAVMPGGQPGGQAPEGAQGAGGRAADPAQAARAAADAPVVHHRASPRYTELPELFPR